jgi:hypothetical protein
VIRSTSGAPAISAPASAASPAATPIAEVQPSARSTSLHLRWRAQRDMLATTSSGSATGISSGSGTIATPMIAAISNGTSARSS